MCERFGHHLTTRPPLQPVVPDRGRRRETFGDIAASHEMMAATDDALFLRCFTAEPLRARRSDPRFAELLESLDRSWEIEG